MIISACLITKDDSELPKLEKAIESLSPFVDSIYITANGEKVDKIKEYCSLYEGFIYYSYLKWDDDFSKQRNFNFEQARKDSDFIFWMDSDDILVGGPLLKQVAQLAKDGGKDVVFFTYWYGCKFKGEPSIRTLVDVEMEHMRERLIRPGTHRWMGRLHETPVPITGAKNNYTSYPYDEKERPMAILHTAPLSNAVTNMKRNKRILELQLTDEIKRGGPDPRTQLYLMKIYAEENISENWGKVLVLGKEYLEKSGWDEERGTCNEQMAIVSGKMGKEDDAVKYLHEAIREWPGQPLFYIRLAQSYFNIKNYRGAKHWLTVASKMDLDNKGANISNFKAMKVLFAELLMKISYNVDKDISKSVDAAKLLYQEEPIEANKQQLVYLSDLNDLNEACKNTHKLAKYLKSIGDNRTIVNILDVLPDAIVTQPLFVKMRRDVAPSRKWEKNEICYFANFGGKHFEQWDLSSLGTGMGGSETAVIKLAQEWTKLGWKVTVYGDPFNKGIQEGVNYLPWYYFNYKDSFNIFIQWRGWTLSDKIKAKKFFVDLHDVYSPIDITKEHLQHIDKIFVKSKYHRELAPLIPEDKFLIVSNGITI
jgi:tetratricopeptide (TPR) repeat protein